MKRTLLLVSSILVSVFSIAQSCNSLRYQDTIFHNVTVSTFKFGTATPYGLLAQPQDLYLDFYQPNGDTLSKRPLIVFQFGGGFTIGWRSEPDIPGFCNYFAKCGYAVASIDYRIGLNPLDTNSTVRAYYRGVQDERSAIRYLCQRAPQFKFDTSLIVLTGTSAGCFCAFANAFTNDAERPASSFGSFLEPDDLGCLDCSGNTDFAQHIPHIKAIVNQWGAIMDTAFIETSENTPVISFHGDQDILVPYTFGYPFSLPVFPHVYGSASIHPRLTNVGIKNVLHPLVGFGHEPELFAPQLNDTIYNYTRPFLYELLKPVTSDITGDTILCAGTPATYSVINTTGSKYCWSISANGAVVDDNNNSITVIWNDTGTVSVTVKELNYIMAAGEERSFQTQVIPHAISNFSFTTNELEVSFTNLSADANFWFWDFGNDSSSLLENPAPQNYASGGTYEVTLIATNDICADTYSATFVIDSCPLAAITYQLNSHNAFFYTPVTNTTSYFWNFGNGDSASVASPNVFHQYPQNGNYLITVTVENQLGCKATDTLTISVDVATSVNDLKNAVGLMQTIDGFLFVVYGSCIYQAEVFDMTGRKIDEQKFIANFQLSTAGYSSGMYLLKISNGGQVLLKKFIKQ